MLRLAAAQSSQHKSVSRRRWRRAIAKRLLIALTEAVAIIFKRRRRYGWVAESWMAISIRRHSLRDVVPCRIESVMKAALRDLSECGWRWRRSIHNRPRMRTTGNGERQCQYNKCECFTHFHVLEFSVFMCSPAPLVGRSWVLTPICGECCPPKSIDVPHDHYQCCLTGFWNLDNRGNISRRSAVGLRRPHF